MESALLSIDMARSNDPDHEYSFEMFDLRRELLAMVAAEIRDGNPRVAKRKGARMVRQRSEWNGDRNADAFETAFERARELISDDGDTDIEIEDAPSIIRDGDHDGVIQGPEIDGDVAELIHSIDRSGFGDPETTTYPVVDHASGYRVCTCPAQKNFIVCKHTLARVIERNQPAPVDEHRRVVAE
jgi:hypothetical protein